MNETLLRSWWLLALRGVISILFGVFAILWPAVTLIVLAAMFAAFALLSGAVAIFGAIKNRGTDKHWWIVLLFGIVSLAAGAIATLNPAITVLALILLVGANAAVTGVLDVVVAIRVRKFIRGEWLLILSGAISILFGLIILLFPQGAGAFMLAMMIGLYALFTGVLLLLLSLRVRSWSRINAGRSSPAAGAI